MTAPRSNAFVIFDSIHYVLAAERLFKARGLWCDLVPAPRELSADCGMAFEFRADDLDSVREVLRDPELRVKAVYLPGPEGPVQVDW